MQIRAAHVIIYVMELHEANRILRSVKAALAADGYKLPSSAETDGLLMLLGRLDADKFLAPKIQHARERIPVGSAAYERSYKYFSFFRALQAAQIGIANPVTSVSMMFLHKTLCGDLDEEAGKPRTSEALTCGSAHTDPKYISGSLKSILTKMNEMGSSPETSKEDFAGYLSHYMRELIILHPFARGSEFTLRIFIMLFCKLKGFSISYYRAPVANIIAAENGAFADDDVATLYKLLCECLSYDHKTEPREQNFAPRTRREVARDVVRSNKSDRSAAPKKQPKQNNQSGISNDEILKRAIRLQQKISRLNEQLTELIQPLEDKDSK